ncbi:hypothetical protein QEZ48_07595 [Aquamicrobium lusatiense]|uniref:phosphoribosyltransferase-like protein n=1 Tax=Aquamicrobium lusatiense TaxID=89772 RepID=UPI002454D3CE|nr:hypothetical protein [Aquamicrobium lusatiense]MDH4990693.1 hypothetical protein [Aquamicrobium lusatiense]
MANTMALNLIAEVMGWEEGETSPANQEYAWLRMMSAIKYDGYADFRAGVRFIENLAVWLKQFNKADRQTAYDFFKRRLVYISPAEMQCLIEIFVPEVVTPDLRHVVAEQMGIKAYEVWATPEGAKLFKSRLRRTLFIGMSDGSRTDILRRANAGRLSTEQVVATLAIDDKKWLDLNKELVDAEGEGAKFDSVYLIEDFTASGTTFIRQKDGVWKGKLAKFNTMVKDAREKLGPKFPLTENFSVHIHHYISSAQARLNLDALVAKAQSELPDKAFGDVTITEGLKFPATLKLHSPQDDGILGLCARYHDPGLDERLAKHLAESGISSVMYGYAECALPVILEHNTPNNSIPLLWADTEAAVGQHSMASLFHRRERHG